MLLDLQHREIDNDRGRISGVDYSRLQELHRPMNLWLTSDSHFSHAKMMTFDVPTEDPCGPDCNAACRIYRQHTRKLRTFSSVEEMDETLVNRWNAVVKPSDHVWHLGDVALKKPHLAIVRRLNGHKRLVPGNHDIFDVRDYIKAGFEKIAGMRIFDGYNILCTHIPVHPGSKARFRANVHGHTHNASLADPWYVNVSVEVTDYTPVALETIMARLK